jgi:hypothetical protein
MDTPQAGPAGGCAPIAADLAAAMIADPAGYYVNVHTAPFRAARSGGSWRS